MTNDALADLLDARQESTLARAIEAGLLAQEALAGGWRPADATDAELLLIADDGRAAWDQFVLANARLVFSIARAEARRTGLDQDDLTQEGFLAMVAALRRFDHTRGRFSTYAVPQIRQQVTQAASTRLGDLGLPPSVAVLRRRALAIAGRLDQENQRPASVAEVSTELGRHAAWTRRVIDHAAPASLADAEGGNRDVAANPAGVDYVDTEVISRCLATLPQPERSVLRLRFGFTGDVPLSYAATGDRLGLSASGVRRIEQRGLKHVRRHLAAPV